MSEFLDMTRGLGPPTAHGLCNALPCFPLKAHHVNAVLPAAGTSASATPSDFHSFLCHAIRKAQRRILLASLYVGPGVGEAPAERELLLALQQASSTKRITIKVLMDASRGLRPVGDTSSARAVFTHLFSHLEGPISHEDQSKVYLFPVLHNVIHSWIPSPLDEVAGVFHIKAYIIDDQLVLSGANLSEEYFQDRQDRYLLFDQGANGLVDFYAQLFEILSNYAHEYHPQGHVNGSSARDQDTQALRQHLFSQLSSLFQAKQSDVNLDHASEEDPIVAYAIPTFQAPTHFFLKDLPFPADSTVTQQFIHMVTQHNPSTTVRLSSAYLNPTPSLMSVLRLLGHSNSRKNNDGSSKDGRVILLTAGTKSHGFAPKWNKGSLGKDRSWIPTAFHHIVEDIASIILPRGGSIILYERDKWTFHAKGLWLTHDENHDTFKQDTHKVHISKPESTLIGTIVGSGNFGFRSEKLDFESNTLVFMNPHVAIDRKMKTAQLLAQDWNDWCHHVHAFRAKTTPNVRNTSESLSTYYKNIMRRWGMRALVRIGRRYF